MVKLSFTLGLLALSATTALAVDAAAGHSHQSDVKLIKPRVPTKFVIHSTPVDVNLSGLDKRDGKPGSPLSDKENVAVAYLKEKHQIPSNQIKFSKSYTDKATGLTHVYANQILNGVVIDNALANININAKNQVISASQTFVTKPSLPKRDQVLKVREDTSASISSSFQALAKYVKTPVDDKAMSKVTVASTSSLTNGEPGFTLTGLPNKVAADGRAAAYETLVNQGDGKLVNAWHIVLQQADHWWSANVDSKTGKVLSINDWVSQASNESFEVYPRNIDTPFDGSRQLVSNPANSKASPRGWVSGGTTTGNNVWAQNNPSGGTSWRNNYRPRASSGNVFNFPLNLNRQPSTYQDAAITQLFYTVNTMHDLSFLYGFDEAAGNFQDVNYSGRGAGGDYVVAFAQDGSGTNNANFATPPDGQHGVMRMYVWTQTNPYRDGDLEQDIVAHEFTHGISNRLTGGPANSNCLNGGEAGGMGEGWSDTVANLLRIHSGATRNLDLSMGVYAAGRGIRNYPYSTNMRTNPETYGYLNNPQYREVHAIGEVWATILYEVIWNLIDANGLADDLFSHDLSKGNSIALQVLLDGMKLQPCSPSFLDARNAIIQAEQNLTGGKNKCAIWKGFAKRGLGVNASSDWWGGYTEDYSVPRGC